jgi:CBS domain-containing protein
MHIRKIKRKRVITANPNDSVVKAAKLMDKNGVGCVVVVMNKKPVGILTDRDVAVRVVARKADLNRTKVKDVMTASIITGEDSQRAADLAKVMQDHSIRRVPTVNKKGELTGIITLDDILYLIGVRLKYTH